MLPHQERVAVEKAELDAKIQKLYAFRHGALYSTLPEDERIRLTRQWLCMTEYSKILEERIEAFDNDATGFKK